MIKLKLKKNNNQQKGGPIIIKMNAFFSCKNWNVIKWLGFLPQNQSNQRKSTIITNN